MVSVNSSRMMPKANGITPPPAPWTMRARISHSMLGATPARNDPSVSAASAPTSTRFLPTASPSRPSSGVATEAESR